MGYNYIILDLNTMKLARKWFKTLVFDNITEADKYAKRFVSYKVIKL